MKNKKLKISVIILALIVIIGLVLSFTYAKYISYFVGTADAQVANWQVKVNNQVENFDPLSFNPVADNAITLGKMAPGSRGQFDIVVDATGTETSLEYQFILKQSLQLPQNLIFTIDGRQTPGYQMGDQEMYLGKIDLNDSSKIQTVTVNWEWPYETDNGDLQASDKQDTLDAAKFQRSDAKAIIEVAAYQVK